MDKSKSISTAVDDITDFRTSYHFNAIIKHISNQSSSNTLNSAEIKVKNSMQLNSLNKISNTFGMQLNIPENGYDDNFEESNSNFLYNMELKFIYSSTLFPVNEDKDENVKAVDNNTKSKKWSKTIDGEIWKNKQLHKIQHLLSVNTNNIDNNLEELTSDHAISLLSFTDFAALNTVPLTQYLALNKNQKKKRKKKKSAKRRRSSSSFHNPEPPEHTFYVNDTSLLSQYSVRKGFLKYGTIGYFDKDLKCIGIYVCAYNQLFTSNDDDWEHIKFVYKVSCFVFVQIYELFIKCYWIKALNFNITIKECLPTNHCLNRLCNIFNIGTISSINETFDEFCCENGLFHRLFAFEYKELIRLINDGINKYEYKSICDELREMGKICNDEYYPFYNDISSFYDVLYEFINNYMNIYFETDKELWSDGIYNNFFNQLLSSFKLDLENKKSNITAILTDLILSSIIYPSICGSHLYYFKSPNFIGLKIKMPSQRIGQEIENDVIQYIESLIYSLRTTYYKSLQRSKLPLINKNYCNLFLIDKISLTKDLWFKFQNDLIKYSQIIRERNKKRRIPFIKCHPQFLNVSIIL